MPAVCRGTCAQPSQLSEADFGTQLPGNHQPVLSVQGHSPEESGWQHPENPVLPRWGLTCHGKLAAAAQTSPLAASTGSAFIQNRM